VRGVSECTSGGHSSCWTLTAQKAVTITLCPVITCGRSGRASRAYVSILTPPGAFGGLVAEFDGQKCRYNWHYEKAMGIQTQEHQRMVDGMV